MINATTFAKNWADGMNNAAAAITAGVAAVTVAPGQAAVARQAKMRANLLAAIDDGTWAARTQAVTLQQWQQAMTQVGINRIADGVRQAQPKVQRFATQLLAFEQQLQAQIDAMPDNTDADANARMLAWANGMRNFQYNPQG